MLAKVLGCAVVGLEGSLVEVEVDISNAGLPNFLVVGLPERVQAQPASGGVRLSRVSTTQPLRPVVALYSTFLTRAFDQVNLDVGLHRLPVVFCIDRAGITGPDGASHHGVLDLALLTKVPGMTVFAPSSAQDLRVMVAEALRITDGPVAIRYARGSARQVPPEQVGSGLHARRVRQGIDVCIVSNSSSVGCSWYSSITAIEGDDPSPGRPMIGSNRLPLSGITSDCALTRRISAGNSFPLRSLSGAAALRSRCLAARDATTPSSTMQ